MPCTIRTPFFTLVSDGKPLRRLLVISKKRSVFILVFHTFSWVEVTIDSDLVRKPGFAPGPSASRAEMLLLHHNPGRQSLHANWRSHVDSHHEPSPSQRDMHSSYTLRAIWCSWPDSHRLDILLERETARRLGAQERNGRWSRYRADTFCASDRRADLLHHPALKLVLSRGNAPRSLAYQASALLLSYERVLATAAITHGHYRRAVVQRPRALSIRDFTRVSLGLAKT